MFKLTKSFVFIFSILIVFPPARAQNPKAGQRLSATCQACHGEKGISLNPLWPNLAGQQEAYLFKQMLAFKNGERQDPMMNPLMKTLSEQDLKDLAAYFANVGKE